MILFTPSLVGQIGKQTVAPVPEAGIHATIHGTGAVERCKPWAEPRKLTVSGMENDGKLTATI